MVSLVTVGLSVLTISAQQYFPKEIPAGNYSGICAIGDDRYAVVSDKSAEEGFFVFHKTLLAAQLYISQMLMFRKCLIGHFEPKHNQFKMGGVMKSPINSIVLYSTINN